MRINRRLAVFLIIAAVFAGLFLRYLGRAPKRHYCDFRVYYATAGKFIAREDIYARPDESITPYKYSPMFAMLISPLSFFSRKTASLIFFTLNFALLIAIFFFSGKLIARDKTPFKKGVLLYGLSIAASLRFILHVLDSGQASIIMFALVLLGLYFLREKREMIAASLIGLSVMVKYTPAIFLPYLVFKRKIRLSFLILLFIVIYCLLPAIYLGMEKEADYVKSWVPFISETSFEKNMWYDYKNQSLFALTLRYFTKVSPYRTSVAGLTFNQGIFTAFITGSIIYLFIVFPASRGNPVFPADYSLLFISMALFNPNAWMHNFIIFIFVYMTVFYYHIKVKFSDKPALILTGLSFALTTLTSELFIGDRLEKLFEEFSCVTTGALILMFLLFRIRSKEATWTGNAYRS
jgi:hypothetical protein